MLFAHSAKPIDSIPAQPYVDHIRNVYDRAFQNAVAAGPLAFADLYQDAVRLAAEFHDLGKLDALNQEVLSGKIRSRRSLPVNHVDAGVAYLWRMNKPPVSSLASLLVYAHHQGLPNVQLALTNQLRDIELNENVSMKIRDWTDCKLDEYLARHATEIRGSLTNVRSISQFSKNSQLLARMGLSCLVDADHLDTAINYGNETESTPVLLRANERLKQLSGYVTKLQQKSEATDRNRLRSDIFAACLSSDVARGIVCCDSPVGSGKTTAVMAHLLKTANTLNMRRVFVVLPFTNIIVQSADVYRKCLVLDGENPQAVVGEHHHRAEFDDIASRHLSYRWQSPIIVTTAVQFFETLAAAKTAALRKLHQLANSVIFIDESHAALPVQLWPIAWKWLCALRDDWNCHIVLGSGSLSEFWKLPEISKSPETVVSLISSQPAEQSRRFELNRIHFRRNTEPVSLEGLADWLNTFKGPRLLIVNTVQTAAFIASWLNSQKLSVEHLSTALTPLDRKTTLDRVIARLKNKADKDWTFVATSCVEAGVDLSFAVGFREQCSLNSLLQTSGRVNRNGEFGQSEAWSFRLVHDHRLRKHPAFEDSAAVLNEMFDEQKVAPQFCTEAMRREINRAGMRRIAELLVAAEAKQDFDAVESMFRVIDSATSSAIVDKELIGRLRSRERVAFREIQDSSVQIYSNRTSELALDPIVECPGLYAWTLKYDPFLGYMAGVIDNAEFLHNGGSLV